VESEALPPEGGDLESPPSGLAAAFFRERSPLAVAFASHLSTSAVARGLIGPRELPRLWSRHILNCAALGPVLPAGASVADVGSGAGLPGLVLAIARPDVEVLLVEPLLRRVTWLEEVVSDLHLENARVLRARAEELPVRMVDVATARAVAPLERLAGWCLPLVRPHGLMLAIKGRSAAEELQAAEPVLKRLGAVSWRVAELGGDLLVEPTVVVEVRAGPSPSRQGSARARRAAAPARQSRSR
jgi:16S rRNA (guanine527-N7)-methyltransferase